MKLDPAYAAVLSEQSCGSSQCLYFAIARRCTEILAWQNKQPSNHHPQAKKSSYSWGPSMGFSLGIASEANNLLSSLIKVLSSDGKPLGIGTYNPNTSIRVRLITSDEEIHTAFFEKVRRTRRVEAETPPTGHQWISASTCELTRCLDSLIGTMIRLSFRFIPRAWNFQKEIIEALTKTFSPHHRRALRHRVQTEGLKDMPVTVHLGTIDGQ